MHTSEVKPGRSKSYWIQSQNSGELVGESFGEQSAKELTNKLGKVLVKAIFSGVSPGTERLIASGQVPEECKEKMRCQYMGGDFGFPLKYGYSMVGEVLTGEFSGRNVYLMHPHQDYFYADPKTFLLLPENFNPKLATLLANAETALNAVWDSKVFAGENILVVGAGIVGTMTAFILKNIPAVEVTIVDADLEKCDLIKQLGWDITVLHPDEFNSGNAQEADFDFDLAFHTSSSSQGLQLCVDSIGPEGRVIEMSWYGNRTVSIDLGGSFHFGRKQIISSQVSQIAAPAKARWDYKRRLNCALEILKLDGAECLITHTTKFSEMPAMMAGIYNRTICGLSAVIDYN